MEDIRHILKMVEEGTINAKEAERLIEAMGDNTDKREISSKKRFIRIKITEDGESKINLKLPMSLINLAAKIGPKFIPYDEIPNGDLIKEIDWDQIINDIKDGLTGQIIDIEDGDDAVAIYVE